MILREQIEKGISFSLIAVELSRSRAACIGRADRLGITHPNQTRNPRNHIAKVQYQLPPDSDEILAPDANLKPLLDLQFGDCRYPYGETLKGEQILFCGAPATHKFYCRFHHDLTHCK